MKKLVLMRGVSGSGKTTLISNLGLETNVISPDNLRLMISGLEINNNELTISQRDNYKVFKELFNILEQRMENGLFTIIDAANITETQIEKYKSLCIKYSYECVVVDFDVPLTELLNRNSKRGYKSLPEDIIIKMYNDKQVQKVPSFCKKIKPSQLEAEIQFKYKDVSKYKRVVHIGDIHGCYTVLKEGLGTLRFDTLYIFCGDYLDRGIQNVQTLKLLFTLKNRPNVIFLKGNHELNLCRYANGEEIFGLAFEKTKAEIEESNIQLKELKDFCRNLKNYFAYNFQGRKVICTHGGISSNIGLNLVSEYSFIIGAGNYENDIDSDWEKNVSGIYQVHGHRNHSNLPIVAASNSFNLEGEVEKGGYLRTLELSDRGFNGRAYKNNIFSEETEQEKQIVDEDV